MTEQDPAGVAASLTDIEKTAVRNTGDNGRLIAAPEVADHLQSLGVVEDGADGRFPAMRTLTGLGFQVRDALVGAA